MARKINDGCVACGACESACPVGAISMGDGKFEIAGTGSERIGLWEY